MFIGTGRFSNGRASDCPDHHFDCHGRPAIVAFAVVSVCYHWNDFLWPLIVTNTPASRPLTVGLATFTQSSESGAAWQLIMAGTLLTTFPLLVGFFVFQRRFISSFIQSGLR